MSEDETRKCAQDAVKTAPYPSRVLGEPAQVHPCAVTFQCGSWKRGTLYWSRQSAFKRLIRGRWSRRIEHT